MRADENLKICTLIGFFCPKHILDEKDLDEKIQKN